MRNKQLFLFIFLIQGYLYGQTSHDLQIHDTRDVNLLPNSFHWLSSYAYRVRFDFKYNHAINIPGSGTYSTLFTMPQWPDNSGDKMHQLGFNNGGIFFRQGWPSGSSWETWRKILVEDAYGKVGIGTSIPTSVLDVRRAEQASHISITESSDDGYSPALFISRRSRGTNLDNPSAIQNGNYLGGLSIQGFGTSYAEGARIYGIASEQWTASGNGTDIVFATTANQNTAAQTRVVIKNDGNLGVGLLNPSEKLSVNGNVRAKKVIVSQAGWPDYVFTPTYMLMPLSEVEQFIQTYKRLPDMPSATEVEEKGVSVGDNQALLLKKIEELTLHVIQLGKENKQQQLMIEKQERDIHKLKKK